MLARDQPGVETWQEYFIWKLAGYTVKTTNSFFCFMKILLVFCVLFFFLLGKERNWTLHTLKCLGGDILSNVWHVGDNSTLPLISKPFECFLNVVQSQRVWGSGHLISVLWLKQLFLPKLKSETSWATHAEREEGGEWLGGRKLASSVYLFSSLEITTLEMPGIRLDGSLCCPAVCAGSVLGRSGALLVSF